MIIDMHMHEMRYSGDSFLRLENMETAWNVARQGGYEDVSLLATQEFEQIFVLKK